MSRILGSGVRVPPPNPRTPTRPRGPGRRLPTSRRTCTPSAHTHTYTQTPVYIWTQVGVCTNMCTREHTHTVQQTHTHVYTHVSTHVSRPLTHVLTRPVRVTPGPVSSTVTPGGQTRRSGPRDHADPDPPPSTPTVEPSRRASGGLKEEYKCVRAPRHTDRTTYVRPLCEIHTWPPTVEVPDRPTV